MVPNIFSGIAQPGRARAHNRNAGGSNPSPNQLVDTYFPSEDTGTRTLPDNDDALTGREILPQFAWDAAYFVEQER